MKNMRYNLLVNVFPVALLLSGMAMAMVGVNLLMG
jgi:hypothetical protein